MNIETWNVRTLLQTEKLENLKIETDLLKIDILEISEMRWNGQGDYRVIYEYLVGINGTNCVGLIINTKWTKCVKNYIAFDDRLIIMIIVIIFS